VARQQQQNLLVLGQAVRELRVRSHQSVRDLATTCKVSPRRLTELEDGWLDPDLEMIAAIARGIGVRPSEIFVRAEQLAVRDPELVRDPAQESGPQQ
jgi:transcriptional regulator with XRE-family HTH domain